MTAAQSTSYAPAFSRVGTGCLPTFAAINGPAGLCCHGRPGMQITAGSEGGLHAYEKW